MLKGFSVAVVASMVLMMSPSAVAFHGAAFTVPGEVCVSVTPVCLPAVLTWSGGFGAGGGQYRISMGPVGAAGLTVQGREQFTNFFFGNVGWCGFVERVNYLGVDVPTNGVDLRLTGLMENCLGGAGAGSQHLDFTGTYKQVFTLKFKK